MNHNEVKLLEEDNPTEATRLNTTNCCAGESAENLLKDSSDGLNLLKAFSLGVGYAAIIGGSGSLIGGTTNILLKGYFDEKYPNDGLNFLSFMLFSFPVSLIMLAFTWVVLCYLWFPKR
jgi:di/tricarboxylate transporter